MNVTTNVKYVGLATQEKILDEVVDKVFESGRRDILHEWYIINYTILKYTEHDGQDFDADEHELAKAEVPYTYDCGNGSLRVQIEYILRKEEEYRQSLAYLIGDVIKNVGNFNYDEAIGAMNSLSQANIMNDPTAFLQAITHLSDIKEK